MPRRNLGWQLYAGSRTDPEAIRHTRRYPAHSRHDTKRQTPIVLLFGGAIMPQESSRDARTLNCQRWTKARDSTSDGQPEKSVGKICALRHPLNIQKRNAERPWWRSHAGVWERSFRYKRKRSVGCQAAIAGKPAQWSSVYPPTYRPSVSSPAAFDLDPPAPSGG